MEKKAVLDYKAAEVRARACQDSHERTCVLANIGAKNYANAEQLETDLVWLEAREPAKDA